MPADSVIHIRLQQDVDRPWRGVAPSVLPSLASRLLAAVEAALGDESGGAKGHPDQCSDSPGPRRRRRRRYSRGAPSSDCRPGG